MVEIEFLGPIKMHNLKLEAANLSEVKICAVAVNDEIASSLDAPLKDGDKISILPPVCGG